MQRIFFVITSLKANGAERVMSLLANYGASKDIEVALALLGDDTVSFEMDSSIKLFYLSKNLPENRKLASTSRLMRLRSCIKDFKPDVVVSFLTTCNIYTCLACFGFKIPVIISERNDPVLDCPNKLKRIFRNVSYRLAKGFVFQTKNAQSYFSGAIQNRSIVIPNPVKQSLPTADFKNRKKYIVAAGRLAKQKNYPMMLKAFCIFQKCHPDYKLCIYGDGDEALFLKELTIKLCIAESVEFLGLVSDLHNRITDAGMYVLSSDYEGISNSLLECLSMGLPCISTDCPCGGSGYLIENGVNGLLVPVGDEKKMAEAMCRIADSEKLAERLSKNAQKVRDIHSADIIIKKYYDYFELILERNKH